LLGSLSKEAHDENQYRRPTNQEKIGIMVIVMKIEISILAGLLILGTELMARASVQGVEQAIVSTVIEWTMSRVKAAGNVLR
jgi:hypothetical protein